jgi:glycosyltransferase involved in cell wall biosynthesis
MDKDIQSLDHDQTPELIRERLPATPLHAPSHTSAIAAPLEQQPAKFRRTTAIAILNRCVEACTVCDVLGCLAHEELSLAQITEKLEDVAISNRRYASFTPNSILSAHFDSITELARNVGVIPVLQVHPAIGVRTNWAKIVTWLKDGGEIEALFDQPWNEDELAFIEHAAGLVADRMRAVVVPRRDVELRDVVQCIPQALASGIEFLLPLNNSIGCDEVRAEFQSLRELLREFDIQPYRSFESPVAGLPDWFHISRKLEPLFESASLAPAPKVSLIIATNNRKEELINNLRHLQRQTLSTDLYEIIIVDDGSDDGTPERIRQHFARTPARFNFRYYRLNRPFSRTKGDDLYRFAAVRNFAAENAMAENLCFIDPEVLVPTDFAEDVLLQLQSADVVQYPPRVVPFAKSTQRPRYTELDAKNYRAAKQDAWSLGSGLCLSLKRSRFIEVGGFSESFHSYGLEDVFLIWQLNQIGISLRDADKPVFYLEPSVADSEFQSSAAKKRSLASRSAQTFYKLTLNENFYREFFPLLGRFINARRAMQIFGRSQLGRILMMPAYGMMLLMKEPQRVGNFVTQIIRRFKR